MATAEKQQNPVKDEPQDDQKQNLRGPPQEEDSDDYYSDEYDDDYDYSDEDDYYDDEDEPETSGKAMQSYKGDQTISSRDQPPPKPQNIQNGAINRAEEKKSIDDQDGLKLKLDVNLDIEVELKARIHGDLTLALLA
ncbi:hypothetical protein BDV18DRAFT_120457 [Aspergillus unguis]